MTCHLCFRPLYVISFSTLIHLAINSAQIEARSINIEVIYETDYSTAAKYCAIKTSFDPDLVKKALSLPYECTNITRENKFWHSKVDETCFALNSVENQVTVEVDCNDTTIIAVCIVTPATSGSVEEQDDSPRTAATSELATPPGLTPRDRGQCGQFEFTLICGLVIVIVCWAAVIVLRGKKFGSK